MKIMYYNAKNNKYQSSNVLSIENDIVECFNAISKHKYTESLSNLRHLATANNPNWHGEEKKPIVKLIGFN